ncbi:MAG: PIN domain-containing protein [Thermoanaerobaculales bacterium]|nr:PIN domain-containing protein [Thermoanaerobaculales bacterium]
MRVLIDTSVWIDFFNGHPSPEAEILAQLIEDEVELLTCGVIVAEFMQGIRDEKALERLEFHFRDMDWLTPEEPKTYFSAAELYRRLRARGITIRSTIDCLIAVLAQDHGTFLLAKDRDIRLIIESGLLDLREFPLSRHQ